MRLIIAANFVSLIGSLLMIGIGFIKSKKNILVAQSFQFAIMGAANLMLGGITGFISNILSMLRNIITFRWKLTVPIKLGFILSQIIITLIVNKIGLLGWLPVIAASVFTWFLDTESEVFLKIVIIGTLLLWIVYDLCLMNYSAFIFDLLTVASNLIGIYRVRKDKPAV